MATTVTYKGETLTTVTNQTKTLTTQGKYLEDNITLVDVTSGGGSTLITKNITENGTYNASSDNADGYSQVTVNVSGGGGGGASKKQINFIDYDGTVVESYTKTEWQSVSALPSNPSHTGLTAQGWNWTKAQIDAQLTAIPDGDVNVGQLYITDDGKTRIYIHLEEGRLHPYLGICPNGTVVVDWGDNSTTSTLTGTSLTTVQRADHTYASGGDYMITLTVSSGSFAFYGTSNTSYILEKDTSTTSNIHRVYTNAVQKIEIGSNAIINNYAFSYCHSLASITIPSGVTNIGLYAFYYCYSLASITIPSGATNIGNYAFAYCYSLASITIPSSVTNISPYAFNSCNSFTSITIPSGATSIGNSAFSGCSSLTSITIPSGVTSVGTGAFSSCNSLTSITIPSGITSISGSVFSNCYSLASITIPSGVTSIGASAFSGCYSLANITIPSEVTSIGNNAFETCYSLASITIPSGATSIGSSAFSGCNSLTSITIPSGVTSVGGSTFNGCRSLASITIPSGVASIGSSAFSSCYGMAEYHFLRTTPPTLINKNAFTNIQPDCVIYVPSASLEDYQTATNWSTYASYMQGE